MPLVAGIMYEFQRLVNGDDYGNWTEIMGIPIHEMEVFLCVLKEQGCKIQMALSKEALSGKGDTAGNKDVHRSIGHFSAPSCVAMLMYSLMADCVIFIRGLYVDPKAEGLGLGKGLINSLGKPIQRVIFQTQKGRTPLNLLRHTDKVRHKIYENDKLITWEMPWRKSHE